jgi:ribosomal protein S18 acetylase RimI-like enzyme
MSETEFEPSASARLVRGEPHQERRPGGRCPGQSRRRYRGPVSGGLLLTRAAVFVIEADGERVGELWLAEREHDDAARGSLWIYDIEIEESQRGRGYGRAAMLLAEEETRRRGFDQLALNVFGDNDPARSLYRSLGYREAAVIMNKRLDQA